MHGQDTIRTIGGGDSTPSGQRLNQLIGHLTATPVASDLPERDPRFTRSGGTAMGHFPQIISRATSLSPQIQKMSATESERSSNTWLEDFASSPVPGKQMQAGLFRINAGQALEYIYTYEEFKVVVEGVFHLTDGTGQKVVAKQGDLIHFPKGSRITFATLSTALGYFCGQRAAGSGDYTEPVTDPDLKIALAANPKMVHYPNAMSTAMPKMLASGSERDSQTWLGDIAASKVAGKELVCGLFRMNAGKALEYYYDYEEMKFIVEGEFHLTDGTGQRVVAKAGDLMYFPADSSIVFDTPNTALGFFCGQRLVDVPVFPLQR